eukprot:CAMPEP_0179279964 /NCGR_PEP_ID=MMETSP0797-20121207/36386_1 /TAXON_ID=47934 /ORGANISM="Dinophysis acuminata, Strain DAEP01" /LENGTH=172 /DNA_ID=CAMNT_0020988611 /DNA_START=31 /DNA_END=545 /DNA_ORIENTATION=-
MPARLGMLVTSTFCGVSWLRKLSAVPGAGLGGVHGARSRGEPAGGEPTGGVSDSEPPVDAHGEFECVEALSESHDSAGPAALVPGALVPGGACQPPACCHSCRTMAVLDATCCMSCTSRALQCCSRCRAQWFFGSSITTLSKSQQAHCRSTGRSNIARAWPRLYSAGALLGS